MLRGRIVVFAKGGMKGEFNEARDGEGFLRKGTAKMEPIGFGDNEAMTINLLNIGFFERNGRDRWHGISTWSHSE